MPLVQCEPLFFQPATDKPHLLRTVELVVLPKRSLAPAHTVS